MLVKILSELDYQLFPITKDMIEISDEDFKEIGKTKCFDVENQSVIDYVKPEPTLEERLLEYRLLVEKYIRQKYTISDELAILRKKDECPKEFEDYYSYAETCKVIAKEKLNLTEV